MREVLGGVLRESLRVSGRTGIVILDDGTPEARLLGQWCEQELGSDRTWRVTANDAAEPEAEESMRFRARVLARERNALTAHCANKTALLLGREFPVEPLLPLGDLYATQIAVLAGDWSGPADMRQLVELAGGIEATDHALGSWFERWQPADSAVADLPAASRGPFLEAVRRGRFWRERAGLVPKLTTRTIGIDLFA